MQPLTMDGLRCQFGISKRNSKGTSDFLKSQFAGLRDLVWSRLRRGGAVASPQTSVPGMAGEAVIVGAEARSRGRRPREAVQGTGWKMRRKELLSVVRRDGGPEHPDSGFLVARSASAVRRRARQAISSAAGGNATTERTGPAAERTPAARSSRPTAARRFVFPSSRSAPVRGGSD